MYGYKRGGRSGWGDIEGGGGWLVCGVGGGGSYLILIV